MNVKPLYELKKELCRMYLSGVKNYVTLPIERLITTLEREPIDDPAYEALIIGLKDLLEPVLINKTEILQVIHTSLNYLLRINEVNVESNEEVTEQVPFLSIDEINTSYSYQELRPLIQALTQKKKDRLHIVKGARGTGLYQDFRVLPLLNRALDDEEHEIVVEVEEIIKAEVGEKIVPFILSHFESNDHRGNLYRFTLLFQYDYEGLGELIDEIMRSNSYGLQQKVMELISNDIAYEKHLIMLSNSSQKAIREMAYWGLANLKTENAEKQLCEAYSKAIKKNRAELDSIAKALWQTKLTFCFDYFFASVKECFTSFVVAGKKADIDKLSLLKLGITILKENQKSEVYTFLSEVLLNKEYNDIISKKESALSKLAKDVSHAIIEVIQTFEGEKQLEFYEKIIKEMPDSTWKHPFYMAYMNWCIKKESTATDVYDMFLPYYLNRNISIKDIAELYHIGESEVDMSTLDERWIDRFYESLNYIDGEKYVDVLLKVLNTLEPTPSDRFNRELIAAGEKTRKYLLEVTSMIMKRDLPDKYNVVFSLIKQCHDRKDPSSSSMLRQLPRASYWEGFPKEYAVKFRELKNAPRAIFAKIEG